jgi:hypothetical protein
MNACSATEIFEPKLKTQKITTTLYDLVNEINLKYLGRQREHSSYQGNEQTENSLDILTAKKVRQMFSSGKIRFKNPQTVRIYLDDIYI